MLDFPRWKQVWLWFLTLACAAAALPSIFAVAGLAWPAALPHPVVNLGLDLAGGSHLLLEADTNQIRQLRLEQMEESVRSRMAKSEPRIGIGDVSTKDGKIAFMLNDPSKADAAREQLQTLTSGAGTTGQRDWDLAINGGLIELTPTEAGSNNRPIRRWAPRLKWCASGSTRWARANRRSSGKAATGFWCRCPASAIPRR